MYKKEHESLAMFILVVDIRKKSHARTETGFFLNLLVKDIQAIESRALNDNRDYNDKTGI